MWRDSWKNLTQTSILSGRGMMVTPPNFCGEKGKRMWKVIAMQGNNQVIVWFEFYDASQESFSGGARTFGWEPASLARLASNMCKSIVVQYGSSPVWTVLLTEAKWCWLLLDQKDSKGGDGKFGQDHPIIKTRWQWQEILEQNTFNNGQPSLWPRLHSPL